MQSLKRNVSNLKHLFSPIASNNGIENPARTLGRAIWIGLKISAISYLYLGILSIFLALVVGIPGWQFEVSAIMFVMLEILNTFFLVVIFIFGLICGFVAQRSDFFGYLERRFPRLMRLVGWFRSHPRIKQWLGNSTKVGIISGLGFGIVFVVLVFIVNNKLSVFEIFSYGPALFHAGGFFGFTSISIVHLLKSVFTENGG